VDCQTNKGGVSFGLPHPDNSDDEWAFLAPYLTLMTEDAPQREHSLREVLNGLRYVVRTGMQWRMIANDLPPWYTAYQQTQRWQGCILWPSPCCWHTNLSPS
jgi:transposase